MKLTSASKTRSVSSKGFPVFILIFGIVFLTVAVKSNKPVPENYVETGAVIERIEEELSPAADISDGIDAEDYEYSVFIEYDYNGKTYSDCEYSKYSSSMKEGDKLTVFVNPDNPGEFMADKSGSFSFIIVGIIVILIGIIGVLLNIRKKLRR